MTSVRPGANAGPVRTKGVIAGFGACNCWETSFGTPLFYPLSHVFLCLSDYRLGVTPLDAGYQFLRDRGCAGALVESWPLLIEEAVELVCAGLAHDAHL
jgi:hypothetical protein